MKFVRIRGCRRSALMLLGALVLVLVPMAWAAPQHAVPPPQDEPYPGLLTLDVDLTEASRRIFSVHETIPVEAGMVTLLYPQWIPGEHAPSGPIANVVGLVIKGNGKVVPWRRDRRDMYAFHLDVPDDVTQLNVSFQFLSPSRGGQFGAGVSATPALVDMEFNQVAFYPAGFYARDIRIQPTVHLPAGWKFATAMRVASRDGSHVVFHPVRFNDLVDSPLIAGKYFRRVDLAPGAKVPVHLDIVGDRAAAMDPDARQIDEHRNLVKQLDALFGSHPFNHYDLLLTLSDHTSHFGLEHHQSSDNRLMANFFTAPDAYLRAASLMPHEFVHAWNGKFRRPQGLATPNFNVSMQDDMLWVYEGLTDYWAGVLTARAGLWTPQQYRQALAAMAGNMRNRTGRRWRSLQDTADAAPLTYASGFAWHNYRRGTDFYPEGQLLWLDVDTKIRALSDNRHSLDDLARTFFGLPVDGPRTRTYTLQNLIDALHAVQPFDWATFLRTRLDYIGTGLPEQGIARSGWKLAYTDTPSAFEKAAASLGFDFVNLAASAGFIADADGSVYDVQWQGPAFRAGLLPGMTIVAVNGKDFSAASVRAAITAAHADVRAPIVLMVRNGDQYQTLPVNYHAGLRYPHLERVQGSPDYLGEILAPLP